MAQTLLRSGMAVALAILLGRILGFGRDATIAAMFGIDRSADVAAFLIGLPDFLINVLGAGGFTAILVVAYRQRPEDAARLMVQAGLAVLAAVGLLALLLIVFRSLLIDALAPGFDATARSMAMTLLPVVLLSAPVAAMTGPFIGFHQARERFFIAASGAIIINATLILSMLLAPETATLTWLATGILIAALLRWAVLAAAGGGNTIGGLSLSPWLVDIALVKGFVRAAATEAVVFFYPFALRAIATLFGVGALASVNYATKLVQLPLGVVVMTLTTILLPRLAAAAPGQGNGDHEGFLKLFTLGGYWIIGLSGVSVAILVVHGLLLVDLAFGWGEINAEGLARIALYNAVFSVSLLPMGLNVFLRRGLNALGETRSPMWAETAGFAAFIVSALLVVGLEGPLEAVLLTAAAGNVVSTAVLLIALNQKNIPALGRLARPAILAPAIVAVIVAALPGLLVGNSPSDSIWMQLAALIAGGALGVSALVGLNADARRDILDRVRNHRG